MPPQVVNDEFNGRGWIPVVWLGYLVFFLFHPILDHVGAKEWIATFVALGIFLPLYFGFFRLPCPWNRLTLIGMVILGIVYSPWNSGAVGFFIYAASFVPFAFETELAGFGGLAAIAGIVVLEWRFAHLDRWFLFVGLFFSALSGTSSIYFAQRNRNLEKLRLAHEEIEHLAKVAERERIARDLHDVLGHTLSLITLKSELAGKLIDRDPARAKREIRDVEKAAREALAEVRQAIVGYRAKGLTRNSNRPSRRWRPLASRSRCKIIRFRCPPAMKAFFRFRSGKLSRTWCVMLKRKTAAFGLIA